MKDSWFFDKNFNGLSDENFDDVINFFDFPLEDVEPDAVEEDWDAQFNHVEEPCYDVLSMAPLGVSDKTRKGNPKHERMSTSRAEFSPTEQAPETTKVTFVKTIPNPKVTSNSKDFLQFQIYSPVSVFENSSSSSGENAFDQPAIQKRARSKRRPLSSCSPLLSVPFISSPQAFRKPRRAAAAESTSEKSLTYKTSCGLKEKGTEKDLFGIKRSSWKEPIIPRKCLHCHITKTPQWREGPMGPKTLCNACGVRYRSGRLFPEYRPAASPTFVASLHSNCHKKVLEMRNKATSEADQGSVLPLSSKPSEIR